LATANLPASLTVNSLFPQSPRRTKKFHAFRHTFVDLLRNTSDEAVPLIPVFTGHAAKSKNQSDDYGSGFWLKKLHKALHSVTFQVDLARISYADFEQRLGHIMTPCIQAHRDKYGLNPKVSGLTG